MSSPSDLKYTESHEWVRREGDVGTVGITAHAAESLSDLVYIDLPAAGDTVTAGKAFGEIESVKAVSDLTSPVTGEVMEVNSGLEDNLSVINSEPYGEGWMIKVKLQNGLPEGLLDPAAYDDQAAADAS